MPLISNLKGDILKNARSTKGVFKAIKPFLIDRLKHIIYNSHTSRAGRPITVDFDIFFKALFHVLDSGSKITSLPDIFGISKTTFLRYLKLLNDCNFFEEIHKLILNEVKEPNILIVDSFLVKSTDGREGTGRNPCDRDRRGLKIFLACSDKLIHHHVIIKPANVSENSCLREAIQTSAKKRTRVLADAGYVGKKIALECQAQGYRLIAKPRLTRNGQMTHKLNHRDTKELNLKRNRVEHINSRLRSFRGVDIKRVKLIATYTSLVYFSVMLVAIFQMVFY